MDRMWNFKGCFARKKKTVKKEEENHKKIKEKTVDKRWELCIRNCNEEVASIQTCINVLIVQTTQISFYFYSFG